MVNSRKHCFQQATKNFMICMSAMVGVMLMNMPALAHKVNVFAYVEGDSVVVEGYFGGNVRALDCPLEVFDESGKKIHEGKTDKKGNYSFRLSDLPAFSGGLKIVLEAGMGHKAEYTLNAADIPEAGKMHAPPKEHPRESKPEQAPRTQTEQPPSASPVVVGSTQVMDQAALTAAWESALDKKLAPIVRMLGNQEKLLLEEKFGGPKLKDVIGGIGWIMGLVGIAAFFWARNRPEKK